VLRDALLGVLAADPTLHPRDVLVLTPDHSGSWADLDEDQVGLVMAALRDRIEAHAGVPGIRYSQGIVNHGREAGASINHPHGQLLGIPFVPGDIADEEAGFARFAGGCVLCTTLEAEVEAGHRTVLEDDLAVVVAPFWSGTPFELLVIPRAHESHLDRAKPADLAAVGRALRTTLGRLRERQVQIITIGQYLRPTERHLPVVRYWHPDEFKALEEAGYALGFDHIAAGPLVRSSYHADQHVPQDEPGHGPLAAAAAG